MRNFLKAEAYYMKMDSTFKGISLIFLVASIGLNIWIGALAGFNLSSTLEPLRLAASFSLFLYFIIPVHACFFSTEGFEYGSIKNIIASGQSRFSYFIGKYLLEVKAIFWWLFQFVGLFYLLCIAGALFTGSFDGNINLEKDSIMGFTALGFNILYLSAYAAIVMMVGILVRKAASASIVTFAIIFGDLILCGYLKDSPSAFLRMLSSNTLMTQIMKFSGVYSANSQRIVLSGANDYIRTALIPIIITAICLTISLISFEKRDIHT